MPDVTTVDVACTGPSPRTGRPLLVLGPSLGTSAATLWGRCLPALRRHFDVVAWDLPGHGASRPPAAPFGIPELATAVLASVAPVLEPQEGIHYAGDSIGGAVGLQLLLDHPHLIHTAVLLCTGARIGTPEAWHERADLVRGEGTAGVVDASRERWFGPGFTDREPAVAEALLDALRHADAEGYAGACEALAAFDVRDRLGEIAIPVLAVAGSADGPTPPETLEEIVRGVGHGRVEVLTGVGHLAPAEAPDAVAGLIGSWCSGGTSPSGR